MKLRKLIASQFKTLPEFSENSARFETGCKTAVKVFKSISSFGALTSAIVLTAGVFLGVLGVKESQDIRKMADEVKEHKVAVCHKTGSDSNSWTEIEVSDKALSSHLEHGDIQGNCPSQEADKEKGNDKGNDSNQEKDKAGASGGNTGGTVALANNVTVNNQTVAVSGVKVETKYIYVTTQFDFWITFQGITEKKPEKMVRVILRSGEDELHVYNKVEVSSDDKGVYHGTITDVKPGTYEVLIKSDGFLQRKFSGVDLKKGKNNNDWSDSPLLAGDFNSDNILEALDVAEFLSFVVGDFNPITSETKIFDIDMNGNLSFDDLKWVIANYKDFKVEGEN